MEEEILRRDGEKIWQRDAGSSQRRVSWEWSEWGAAPYVVMVHNLGQRSKRWGLDWGMVLVLYMMVMGLFLWRVVWSWCRNVVGLGCSHGCFRVVMKLWWFCDSVRKRIEMGDGEGTKSRKSKIEKQSDEGVFFFVPVPPLYIALPLPFVLSLCTSSRKECDRRC